MIEFLILTVIGYLSRIEFLILIVLGFLFRMLKKGIQDIIEILEEIRDK